MAASAKNGSGPRASSWRAAPLAVAGLLLLLPLVAMHFTIEVNWDETDFIVMGALLIGACAAFEMAARTTGNNAYQAAVGVGVLAALLLIWINLAVGIIGSEDNPANLMYAGVLAGSFIGVGIARFQPGGMARVLVGTACAQALSAVIAVIFGWGSGGENWPQVIVFLNGFFAALWLLSAWLFRTAAKNQTLEGSAT